MAPALQRAAVGVTKRAVTRTGTRITDAVKRADWPTFFRSVIKGVGAALGSILVYGLVVWLIYRYMKKTNTGATAIDALKTTTQVRAQGVGLVSATVNSQDRV